LATVTDSTDLLKAEIEKEEALLAKETKQLQEMEKNAKRAEAERKRQLKNVSRLCCCEAAELVTDDIKEHPVLRQLSVPGQQSQDHTQFTLAGANDLQTTFDEVITRLPYCQAVTNVLSLARKRP
jgi:kinetochore protein Fta7